MVFFGSVFMDTFFIGIEKVIFTGMSAGYVFGVDMFKTETGNIYIYEMKDVLEANGYIYEVPLYIDNNTVLVEIAKGQPPDEEVAFTEEKRAKVGKAGN